MENQKEKLWVLRACKNADAAALSEIEGAVGLSPIVSRLLYHRGLTDAEAVRRFLSFEDTAFHSPFLMKDMEAAVARVRLALDRKEKIVIYGDYDVDGVTSVSLLYLYLRELGGDVTYYIPSRTGEGYGVSMQAVQKLAAEGAGCIITVDTGITASREAEYAASLGVDMVITDHHECQLPLPQAAAVVNPHRPDCEYPFGELAGVGVAFKLACAVEASIGMEKGEGEIEGVRRICRRFADLVAIGTIADVMPIRDENRLIVKLGLDLISEKPRLGVGALIDEAARPVGAVSYVPSKRKKVTSQTVSFGIAPRLNAAGRMCHAMLAVELLLSDTSEDAMQRAAELCEINRVRQAEENRIAEEVYRRIEAEFDPEETRVLVLEDDSWQHGIIGIVSSRVTERYGLPSILISFDGTTRGFAAEDDQGKGSGRSVKGLNLVEALMNCQELLVKFGGHELAAGLTVTRENLPKFREKINTYAAGFLPAGGVPAQLDADLEISLSDVTLALAEELTRLEPFGTSNPVPHFILRDVRIDHISELSGGRHLKLSLEDRGSVAQALYFSMPRSRFEFSTGDRVDLLCTLDVNEYRDMKTVQLVVRDCKPSARFDAECAALEETYREIRLGKCFTNAAYVPEYTDFAHVYKVIRREFGMGNTDFSAVALHGLINASASHGIHYVALRYILEVFREMNICGVEEIAPAVFRFEIYAQNGKTSIEKSQILKKLKGQLRDAKEGGDL